MGKAVGYIAALVAVVIIVVLLATHGKKEQGPARPDGKTPPPTGQVDQATSQDTYAALEKLVARITAEYEEASKTAPAGAPAPPLTLTMLNNRPVKDKGRVLQTEEPMGRGTLYIDVDGDSQPDLKVDLGGYSVPAGVTQGVTVEFAVTVDIAEMQGGKLRLMCTSAPQLIKVVTGS